MAKSKKTEEPAAPATVLLTYVGPATRRIVREADFASLGIPHPTVDLIAVWAGGDQVGPRVAEVTEQAAAWLLEFENKEWAIQEPEAPVEPEMKEELPVEENATVDDALAST